MNWVGGARRRVKLQGEKKLQKEFFERKKLEAKPWKKSRRSPVLKQNSISSDLLALQTVSKIQCSLQDAPNSVRKLDLDQFRSTVMGRRYNEIELPSSPNETPSMIHLYEKVCFSSDGTPSSQSLRHRTDSKPVLSQCKNTEKSQTKVKLESKQGSSQHNIFINQQTKHQPLDPFRKVQSFNMPSSVASKKSCLKLNCDKSRKPALSDFQSHGICSGKFNQTRPSGLVFDPWAVEDFQATPLVNYEITKKRGSCSSLHGYRSLKDAGYFTDQERFHKPTSQLQNIKDRNENSRYRPVSLETFEVSLDHNPKKSNLVCRFGESVNDIYDEYIENRFRGPKPLFSRANDNRSSSDKRTVDVDSSSKQTKFADNGHRFEPRKDCFFHNVSKKSSTKDCSFLNVPKKSSTPRPSVNTNGTYSIFPDARKPTPPAADGFYCRKVEKTGSVSGYGTSRKREDEFEKSYSPIAGDLFPNARLCPDEFNFIKHTVREPSNSIKSAGSTSSSCSDTRLFNNKEGLSDVDSDTPGTMGLCSDSHLFSEKKTRLKTSSVDEILEEMERLESESEDAGRDSERYNVTKAQREVTGKADSSAVKISSGKGETADDDDVLEEVSQVLQELVHKVVLLNSQLTDHDNLGFIIPSRSITLTPWKTFKSLHSNTTVSSHTSVTKCEESSVCIKKDEGAKVHQQPLNDERVSFSRQVRLDKPDGQLSCDNDHTLVNCSVTPNWNKLNLASPLTKPSSFSLPQVFVDMSDEKDSRKILTFEEKILQFQTLTEKILTPKKTYESVGTDENLQRNITSKMTSSTWKIKSGITQHDSIALSSKAKMDPHPNQHVQVGAESFTPTSDFNSSKQISINERQIKSESVPLVETSCQTLSTDFGSGETKSHVNDMSTQTYFTSTADSSTSPVQFMRPEQVDAATQYDVDDTPVFLNESEVSMEQGDSQELMDCTVPVEVGPADGQWTISDTMLESLSQSDARAGYALRSRKKAIFPPCVI